VGGVLVWDVATRRPLKQLRCEPVPWGLGLSGDGRRLVASPHKILVWDTATFTQTFISSVGMSGSVGMPSGELTRCLFSFDGSLLAISSKSGLGGTEIWDLDKG